MARTIKIINNLADTAPKTSLSASLNAGVGSASIKNVSGFSASWAVQVGATNQEKSEILLLGTATPSGTSFTFTTNSAYAHPTDTPVYGIKYDTIVVYRSETGTTSAATAIPDGTINIQPDSDVTVYDDTAGQSTYAYRVSFQNSVLGTSSETDLSDWLTDTGYSFYSLGNITNRVKSKLFSTKYIPGDVDETIKDWTNEWLETMSSEAIEVNQDYLIGTVNIAHGTDGLGTITNSDFRDVRKVAFTTNGTDYFVAGKKSIIDYKPGDTYNNTHPYYYFQGDNVIGKLPYGEAGTMNLTYYARPTLLDSPADELPVIMRSYTNSFVSYNLAQASYLDNKEQMGDRYMAMADREKEKFIQQITPRSKSGPEYITLTDDISGEDFADLY
jgi:hypothetical protein